MAKHSAIDRRAVLVGALALPLAACAHRLESRGGGALSVVTYTSGTMLAGNGRGGWR